MFALNKKEKTSLTCFWWAGMDSNHRTHTRTDLQSAAFSHSATYPYIAIKKLNNNMVRPQGFEPWTHRL